MLKFKRSLLLLAILALTIPAMLVVTSGVILASTDLSPPPAQTAVLVNTTTDSTLTALPQTRGTPDAKAPDPMLSVRAMTAATANPKKNGAVAINGNTTNAETQEVTGADAPTLAASAASTTLASTKVNRGNANNTSG